MRLVQTDGKKFPWKMRIPNIYAFIGLSRRNVEKNARTHAETA